MRGELTKELFPYVPEIDFNSGYRYFLGNMDNYAKALMSTLKSIKSKLPLLYSMFDSKEYEGLRTISQTLRIILGNIGATALAEEAYQLEQTLFMDDNSYIREQLGTFINSITELSDHLELLLMKTDVRSISKTDVTNTSYMNYDFTKTKESIKLSGDLLKRKII